VRRGCCCSCCCFAEHRGARRRPGIVSGLFLIGYAVARMSGELFRQPDAQLGFLVFGTTMGQLLSIPVLIAGIALICGPGAGRHRRRRSAGP
jgi:phosphatidylglycerol:prolipoprotein diacylglycerol transferase